MFNNFSEKPQHKQLSNQEQLIANTSLQLAARTSINKNIRITSQIQPKSQGVGVPQRIGMNPPPQKPAASSSNAPMGLRNQVNSLLQPNRVIDRQNTMNRSGQGDQKKGVILPTSNIKQINSPLQSSNIKNNGDRQSFLIRKTNVNIINSNKNAIASNNLNFSNNNNNNSTRRNTINSQSESQNKDTLPNPPKIQHILSTSSANSDFAENASSSTLPSEGQPQLPQMTRQMSNRVFKSSNQSQLSSLAQSRQIVPSSPQQSQTITNNSQVSVNSSQTQSIRRSQERTHQQIANQRLNGPQSSWLQRTQNASQEIDQILTQTNTLIRVANIQSSTPERSRNIQHSPSRSNSADSSHSIEELRRDLDNLSRERRQREQTILERQRYEDQMAQVSRIARQRIRQDFRFRNGHSSSSSEEERKEEVPQEEIQQPMRGRLPSHSSVSIVSSMSEGSSDNEEEERKEERPQIIQRSQISQNWSNRINEIRQRQSHLRTLRRNNPAFSNNRQPQNLIASNTNNINPPDPVPNVANNEEHQRALRLIVPLTQVQNIGNVRNQRNMMEGLRTLVDMMNNRLGNLQGQITSSNIEELAQIVATIRLLQGIVTQKGLSSQQINEFPLVTLKCIEQDEICSICLEDWNIGDQAKLLGCMHKFHPHCIESWLKERTICPNCKQDQKEFFSDQIPDSLQQKSSS